VNASRGALAGAASNPTDILRGVRDLEASGERRLVLEQYRDQPQAAVESKHLHYGANEPLSKATTRTINI